MHHVNTHNINVLITIYTCHDDFIIQSNYCPYWPTLTPRIPLILYTDIYDIACGAALVQNVHCTPVVSTAVR